MFTHDDCSVAHPPARSLISSTLTPHPLHTYYPPSEEPVDAIEAHVLVNPSYVPLQVRQRDGNQPTNQPPNQPKPTNHPTIPTLFISFFSAFLIDGSSQPCPYPAPAPAPCIFSPPTRLCSGCPSSRGWPRLDYWPRPKRATKRYCDW